METYSRSDLIRGLREVGLRQGDLVFFQSRLYGLGLPEGISGRDAFCHFFLDAILEVLGPTGTLVVPTFTTQVARYNVPFVVEETVPNYGLFPEFIYRHPAFLRSLHPTLSVAATGPLKETICRSGSASNFGAGSPFDMMVRLGAKNVFCGLEISSAATIAHYAEFHYGVPYIYHKLLKWRPIEGGVPVAESYLAAVRYLEYDTVPNTGRLQRDLFAGGLVKTAHVGNGMIHAATVADMLATAYRGLQRDPYYFLVNAPEFDYGIKPYDGPSLASEVKPTAAADQAAFERALAIARPIAPRLTGLLGELALRWPPEARPQLLAKLSGRREIFFTEGERLAVALLAAAEQRGRSPQDVAATFLRSSAAQDEAGTLDNRTLELLLDDTRWRLLRFARSEFFAPFCLRVPRHVDLVTASGWFAVLAVEFGAEGLTVLSPRACALEQARGLLDTLGVASQRNEFHRVGDLEEIPCAAGSVNSIAAAEVLECPCDARRLFAEICRVLVRGGAAYCAGAAPLQRPEEVRDLAYEAGLRVERDLTVGGGIGYGVVLRK